MTIRRINTDFLYVIIDVLLAAMSTKAEMVELIPFLNPKGQRSDIITLALQHVLGMSASEDGLKAIKDLATEAGDVKTNAFKHLIYHLVGLLTSQQEAIAKDASLTLINFTANQELVTYALGLACDLKPLAVQLWRRVEDKDSPVADPACMILSNLTICKNGVAFLVSDSLYS